LIVLGIETSCDETATAVCRSGSIISSHIRSQAIHEKYGGVIPEIASREHERYLNNMVSDTLKDAGISKEELEGIAVTQGPGLSGTLITGVCFAKGLSLGMGLPIIGVNHLEAHIFANFLADPTLEFPFVCLLVSGGHTQLWYVKNINNYQLMGESRDDAAGEAFDKGARILGLAYPGGPEIEKLSKGGNPNAVKFPRAMMKKNNLEFSFSGLKTSLLYYMDEQKNANLKDVAASYQQAIIDVLITKLKWALAETDCHSCVIAGGVAANQSLRQGTKRRLSGEKVLYPDLSLCTDNAAMIAYLGELYLEKGKQSEIDFPILPNMKLA
jgi:N6-L-threonylcarbamoyladenine synthase